MPQVTYVGTADTPSTAVFWGVEMTKTQTYTVANNHPSLRHPWFVNADAQTVNTTANTAQSSPTTQATNVLLDELDNLFNGTTTTFALKLAGTAFKPETAAQLNVHIDNTYMVPGTDFTVSNTNIVFAKAPAPGANGTIIALNTSNAALASGGTIAGDLVISSGKLTLSGNISAPAWTTNGIRYSSIAATLTDTSSSGTVAAAYTNVYGGNTIAASAATTFTDYFTTFLRPSTAGTNVTLTRSWALGTSGHASIDGVIKGKVYTVSTLPSAATMGAGSMAFVSDAATAQSAANGGTVAGGGANFSRVTSDGTNWKQL